MLNETEPAGDLPLVPTVPTNISVLVEDKLPLKDQPRESDKN